MTPPPNNPRQRANWHASTRKHKVFYQGAAAGLMLLCLGLVPCAACSYVRIQSVQLPLHYSNAPTTLTNNAGWQVTLRKATLSIGAIRCLSGKPAYSMRLPAPLPLLRWLGPREAHAHPGHYQAQSVKAELLLSRALDLIAPKEAQIGVLQGFTGWYGSAEIEYSATDTLRLEGSASKEGQEHDFAFSLAPGKQLVTGISFTHEVTAQAPALQMRLDMPRLFAWVDFTQFKAGNTTPDEVTQNILRKALHSNTLYQIKTK